MYYLILSPLLESKLARNECLEWANNIIALAYSKTDDEIDLFKLTLLWTPENLSQERNTATSLLHLLVENLYEAVQTNIASINELEKYVLKHLHCLKKKLLSFESNSTNITETVVDTENIASRNTNTEASRTNAIKKISELSIEELKKCHKR